MKSKAIPVSKCEVPETRVTATYDSDLTELLSDTIEAMGQLQPIVVVQDGERFLVVDGKHRLDEAKRTGKTEIEAVIYQGDEKTALLQNLVLNNVRGKTPSSELVTVMNSLFNDHNMTIEEIVKATGYKQALVEKYLNVASASPMVLEMLDAQVMGIGVAYEISRLPEHIQQDEIASKYRVWGMTTKDIKTEVDGILSFMKEPAQEPLQYEPPPKPVYTCGVCQTVTELQELRAVPTCPQCYSAVFKLVNEFKAKLIELEKTEKSAGGAPTS